MYPSYHVEKMVTFKVHVEYIEDCQGEMPYAFVTKRFLGIPIGRASIYNEVEMAKLFNVTEIDYLDLMDASHGLVEIEEDDESNLRNCLTVGIYDHGILKQASGFWLIPDTESEQFLEECVLLVEGILELRHKILHPVIYP